MALIALALVGAALVVTGAAMISPPWGLIVAGCAAIGLAYLIAEETK